MIGIIASFAAGVAVGAGVVGLSLQQAHTRQRERYERSLAAQQGILNAAFAYARVTTARRRMP